MMYIRKVKRLPFLSFSADDVRLEMVFRGGGVKKLRFE